MGNKLLYSQYMLMIVHIPHK